MGAVSLVCYTVHVATYASRVKPVKEKLWDCFSKVFLSTVLGYRVSARGKVQVGHGYGSNVKDYLSQEEHFLVLGQM